jgi:hypothetical protein
MHWGIPARQSDRDDSGLKKKRLPLTRMSRQPSEKSRRNSSGRFILSSGKSWSQRPPCFPCFGVVITRTAIVQGRFFSFSSIRSDCLPPGPAPCPRGLPTEEVPAANASGRSLLSPVADSRAWDSSGAARRKRAPPCFPPGSEYRATRLIFSCHASIRIFLVEGRCGFLSCPLIWNLYNKDCRSRAMNGEKTIIHHKFLINQEKSNDNLHSERSRQRQVKNTLQCMENTL